MDPDMHGSTGGSCRERADNRSKLADVLFTDELARRVLGAAHSLRARS
jgi:hypothetical protein